MLLDGELDALEIPDPPGGFYDPGSPFVRLFPDYRSVERAYYERARVFPGLHIILMRRAFFESDPWIARSVFDAMLESRRRWEQLRLEEADTSPWLQADLEETIDLMGSGWQEYGVDANRHMMEVFCSEMKEQGHASRLVDVDELFKDFEAVPS
jgi:4,5-dihydroxyphthalate decarboxylase